MVEKILIIPWGNPFEWGSITYVYEMNKNTKIAMNTLCTLPILKEAIKPNRIIVIVLDTLANLINEKTNEPPIEQREFSSYNNLLEDVKERIKYFVENKLKERFDDITLIIAPGVGVFKNIEVHGDILDYYHYITYKLAELLPVTDMEVYLDLTHGINFMPVLTYRAVSNLLGLASYLRDVKLTVLNSEPYPRGVAKEKLKDIRLNIKSVENREVQPKPIMSLLSDAFNRWNAFISSVANGFPLVLATFYPKEMEVKKEVDNRLNIFFKNIEVNGKIVKRCSKLDSDFKTLSKIYYLLRVLNTIDTFRHLPKQELTLEELRAISDKLFRNLPRIGVIVEEQIKHLEELLTTNGRPQSRIESSWKPLLNYIKTGGISGSDSSTERTVRNFIAHSGFEYNVTMVRRFFDKLQFKYRSKEKVMSYAIKSMSFRLGDQI
jgi:CRISPR-associated protein Csx1